MAIKISIKIKWIYEKERITKQDYNAQVGMRTEFSFVLGGRPLIIVSLADAIQILSKLQSEEKRAKLIRRLIIKVLNQFFNNIINLFYSHN